ncbi:MAG: argininosuccinate lyase [Omnitrophica WOR_2 bacterium SM23_29]|nr:MAG: argininosuccinate lyase [Omnitrophica WOR_2 bacterium SM23_29]
MKKKLWGGRFKKGQDPEFERFSSSISFDYKLAKYDCLGSIAHAKMLGKCKIIPKKDADVIVSGLNKILRQIQSGKFKYDPTAEDIHTNIQNVLEAKVGKAALKLHTARSRNDQVALDTRMYCKEKIGQIYGLIAGLQKSLVNFAGKNTDIIIPGFTHLQHAQPVLLAHHILAYCQMLERDKCNLQCAYAATDVLPLGSCALAGTSLKIDRKYLAGLLGFSKISENSIDAVSDRDYVIEFLSSLSLLSMHLSRLASDLIIWSMPEVGYVEIDERFCTGSSIMPQKVNPDFLELTRGLAGKIYGNLIAVLTVMKGLPLSYNRDMQYDKEPLFDSVERISTALSIFTKLIKGVKIVKGNIERALLDESLYATDLAEYLIKKGVDSRGAHTIVGRLISSTLSKKQRISGLTLTELKRFSPKFESDIFRLLSPQVSVLSKSSSGGTSPAQVKKQLRRWKDALS